MTKLFSLKLILILSIILTVSEYQFAQSQFLKFNENASSITLSHGFSFLDVSTIKYTKSFKGKLDTYVSLGYAYQDLEEFGSPFSLQYYLPSIGADYFLIKKPDFPFSASLGANYTFITSRSSEIEGRANAHFVGLKAQAFYEIAYRKLKILPSVAYSHQFNTNFLRNNNGSLDFGVSVLLPLKKNHKINIQGKFIGIQNRNSAFELSAGYIF